MKLYKLGQEARDYAKRGIDFVADHTKFTLGPAGRAALIGRQDMSPRLVDDAITIVMNLEHWDELVNAAVLMMKEALSLTSKEVGDATATTITLCQSIANAMYDELKDTGSLVKKNKTNSITLKKETDAIYEEVVKRLKEKSRPITKEEIYSVALTSGTYEWIAKIVADVYQIIGVTGHVKIESGPKTEYKVFNGIELSAGYHSEDFINGDERQCVLKNTKVFVTNQPLETEAIKKMVSVLFPLKVRSLVIVAPDFDKNALANMTVTHLEHDESQRFSAVGVKLPTYEKNDVLVDVATLAGCKFMDRSHFTSYNSFVEAIDTNSFGDIDEATLDESKTMLVGGHGDTTERVAELRSQHEKSTSIFDKDAIERRIGSLTGGIAVIYMKENADIEGNYFRLKLENAVNSVQNALKDGVVKGGGLALKEIAEEMESNIITKALKAPYEQIQTNNGEPFEVPADVFDPVINVIGALTSAGHIAGNMLLIESLSADKNEPTKDQS